MTKEYLESSHAAADGYRSYLVERYQGEVYGEALFQAMAAGCSDARRVEKLRRLEQLERETKEFGAVEVRCRGTTGGGIGDLPRPRIV